MIFTFSLLVKNPVAPAVKRAFPRARATRREADWRRQLVRAFLYMSEQSPDQAEELLADYERREREGPDFMRQRPGSVITEAPLVTLDRNERMRLIWKFLTLTRRSWVAKETGRHRGVITRTAESVFGALSLPLLSSFLRGRFHFHAPCLSR